MPKRPCLNCGTPATGTRCPTCRATHRATHHNPRRDLYSTSYRKRRALLITGHLEQWGPVCPGWRVPTHPCDPADLTADHTTPLHHGGQPDGQLQVLCRACNGRKGQAEGMGGPTRTG